MLYAHFLRACNACGLSTETMVNKFGTRLHAIRDQSGDVVFLGPMVSASAFVRGVSLAKGVKIEPAGKKSEKT